MALDASDIVAIAALSFAVAAAALGYLSRLSRRIGTIEQKIVSVETKVNLFWSVVESEVPKLLKSPHTAEFDALLEKFRARTAGEAELLRLRQMVRESLDTAGEADAPATRLAKILLLPTIEERLQKLRSLGVNAAG